MPKTLRIDFVSDVVCPWCAVGLWSLNTALERLKGEVTAEIRFRPFELNPNMGPDGENIVEHIGRKYGSTPEQSAANRAAIRERAAAVGFEMNLTEDSRIWNTFDCHRLLCWAGETGPEAQARLKAELLTAHFTRNRPLNDPATLVAAAEVAGLDGAEARAVLTGNSYADAVRAEQRLWLGRGINSVPAVVVEDKWLISGGQPPEVFEEALRRMAGEVLKKGTKPSPT